MIKTISALTLAAVVLAAAPVHALTTNVDVTVDVGAPTTTSVVNIDVAQPIDVSSDAEVTAYSDALVQSDTNMRSVDSSAEEVSVSYKQRLHIFGFIPVWGTVKSTVRADGTVELQYPWYSFLSSSSRAEVETRVQNSVDVALKDRTETGTTFSARTQAGLIAAMRAALKTSYEADASTEASVE